MNSGSYSHILYLENSGRNHSQQMNHWPEIDPLVIVLYDVAIFGFEGSEHSLELESFSMVDFDFVERSLKAWNHILNPLLQTRPNLDLTDF